MAVPFYLTHPRLERLERAQMLEVEGGDHEWCMRILRHEAGHVIDNVYKLRLRRQRRALFGSSAEPYPEFYSPRPYSKSFVQHIDPWYAQSHPDEDFAETFAVWLTPESNWAQRYAGLAGAAQARVHGRADARAPQPASRSSTSAEEVDPLRRLRHTLRRHYRRKRRHHGIDHPKFYDRELRRLFSDAPEFAGNMTAAQFLGKMRQPVRRLVASWTGIYQYTIDKVLEDMIARCRELKLRLAVPEEQARYEFTVLLTVQTMNYLHSGRHRVALVKKYRVLVLAHKELVPKEDVPVAEVNPEWRMEWDVVTTLRKRGHELLVIGVHDDLTPDPPGHRGVQADHRLQPDGGVRRHRRLRPERRQLSGAAAGAVHGLQPARADADARQGAGPQAARLSPHSVAGLHRRAAQSQAGAAASGCRYPMIVKSLTYESSIGISQASVVANEEQLIKRVKYIHDTILTPAIVEQFIDGRELYVGVLGNHRLRVFPVWEMSFTKMPDTSWRIATERVKWSVKYQKRHGIDTAEAQLPEGVAQQHSAPGQAHLSRARPVRLRAHRLPHGRRTARPT